MKSEHVCKVELCGFARTPGAVLCAGHLADYEREDLTTDYWPYTTTRRGEPIPLRVHIQREHEGNVSAFAKASGKRRQQIYDWIALGCRWYDGTVWQPKNGTHCPGGDS